LLPIINILFTLKNQGLDKPIYGSVQICDKVARRHLFFSFSFIIGDALNVTNCVGNIEIILQMSLINHDAVM